MSTQVSKMLASINAKSKSTRTSYSDAILTQNEFNDELQNWKKRNGIMTPAKEITKFATHLSQKYLCDKLDKLESSETVSKIRKEIAKHIDEIENPKTREKCWGRRKGDKDLFANVTLTIDELSEEYNDVSDEEYHDAKTVNIDIPTDNINLCFVGGVSTGKSTVLNSVFCEELTQCKIKRTLSLIHI